MTSGNPEPSFPHPALDAVIARPRAVLTVTVLLMLAGLYFFVSMPRAASPEISPPVFSITLVQDGMSAEDAENLLVKPMESGLRGLEGLTELTAVAAQGRATLVAEFDARVPHGRAFAGLRETLARARGLLPEGAAEPVIEETSLGLSPVLSVALSGAVPDRTLNGHARQLKDRFEAIPAVLRVDLAGQRQELIEIVIDPAKLESYAISQTELSAAAASNRLIAGGSIDTGNGRFSVTVPGLFTSTRDILSLPLKASPAGVVTLGDIADIRRTFKDTTSYARVNGRPAVVLQIVKRPGANTAATAVAARQAAGDFTSGWPSAIKVDYLFDQSEPVHEILGSLTSGAVTAIALVMIAAIATLGLASALMVGLAIPASLLIGVLMLGLAGISADRMVLFGLILSVGLLVNGAILVVDHADREMAKGRGRRTAYRLAARHMLRPVVASTAATLAAFAPLLLWPGAAGALMSGLPVTVICVLIASLFTAMIALPAVAGLIGGASRRQRDWMSDAPQRPKLLAGIDRARGQGDAGGTLAASPGSLVRRVMPDPALQADPRLQEPPGGLRGLYAGILERLFRHPGRAVAAAVLMLALVFGAYGSMHEGVAFFVDTEPEQGVVLVSARGNLSAEEELALVKAVEAEVMQIPGIRTVFTVTGAPGGERASGGDARADQIGRIAIEFDDYDKRLPGKALLARIRERLAPIPGLQIEVRKRETGPPSGKAVRLEVSSDSLEDAEAVAGVIRDRLDQDRQLRDVDDTRPLPGIEWLLQVDRVAAAQFGADAASVAGAIQLITGGLLLGRYRPADAEDEIDIRARFPADERGLGQLDRLTLRTANGLVPISNFVEREPMPRTGERIRKDRRYAVTLTADAVDGVRPGAKVKELGAWLEGGAWPIGVQFRFRGAHEDARQSAAFLKQAMVGIVLLIFIILAVQFDSFYQAAVTLSTAVLSVAGVLIGIMLTGQAFSVIMTGAAIVALAGIGAANAIVLTDSFNRYRRQGIGVIDAALQGAADGFRPVLVTTLTAIMGVLPLALQIEFDIAGRSVQLGSITSIWWVPFCTALIFGLTFATLLALVLVPTLLVLPQVYAARWREGGQPAPGVSGKAKAPALPHYSEAAD